MKLGNTTFEENWLEFCKIRLIFGLEPTDPGTDSKYWLPPKWSIGWPNFALFKIRHLLRESTIFRQIQRFLSWKMSVLETSKFVHVKCLGIYIILCQTFYNDKHIWMVKYVKYLKILLILMKKVPDQKVNILCENYDVARTWWFYIDTDIQSSGFKGHVQFYIYNRNVEEALAVK